MAYPVSRALTRMSGSFGPRKPIRLSNGQLSPAFHGGVDFTPLAAGSKLPAYAVGRGVVYGVGLGGKAAGLNVMLRLSDGSLWWYCHLSRVDVVKGQAVADGEQIGHIGATGNTTGVHLHLERHYPRLDAETDPWPFIKDEPDPQGKTGDKAAEQITEEGFLMALTDKQQADLYGWVQGLAFGTYPREGAVAQLLSDAAQARFAAEAARDALTKPVDGFAPIDVIRTHVVATLKAVREQAAQQGVDLDEDALAQGVLDALGKRITNG